MMTRMPDDNVLEKLNIKKVKSDNILEIIS